MWWIGGTHILDRKRHLLPWDRNTGRERRICRRSYILDSRKLKKKRQSESGYEEGAEKEREGAQFGSYIELTKSDCLLNFKMV